MKVRILPVSTIDDTRTILQVVMRLQKYLEEMSDNSYWICGHTHGKRIAYYVNSKGNLITIMCNPFGYPNDYMPYCDVLDYTGEKLVRKQERVSHEDFIIDM